MVQKNSRNRKRSKKASSKVSGAYTSAPLEIRSLVSQRHILASESAHLYDNLFKSLAAFFKPTTVPQWLHLKEFHDLVWEQQRMSRIKPAIIDSAQKTVVLAVLESLPGDVKKQLGSPIMSGLMSTWFTPGRKRQALQRLLKTFNYSKDAIDGMAFIQRINEIEMLEKFQATNDLRQQMLYRQLNEETAINVVPNRANDNEESPPQVAHHRDEQADTGEREQAEPEQEVEALEAAGAGDAEPADHAEDVSDEGEANQGAESYEESDDVAAVEETSADDAARESDCPDEEAA